MTTAAGEPSTGGAPGHHGASVHVRRVTPEDQGPVTALLRAAGLPPVMLGAPNAVFFVVESGGRIVGSAGMETYADAGLLRSLAIEEGCRSAGVGRTLVECAIGEAASQALDSVYLLTTTADAYFKRFGFEAIPRDAVQGLVRRSEEFAVLCPASAVAMRLVIGADS